jgi:hypothetical protein
VRVGVLDADVLPEIEVDAEGRGVCVLREDVE